MRLFAASISVALIGCTPGIFGQHQPTNRVVKIAIDQEKNLTMTRDDHLKEVEVRIPGNYLKERRIVRPMWRVVVEVEQDEDSEASQGKNGSKRTLLNVLIGVGEDAIHFQLPRSHASNRDKKVEFESALTRSVDVCLNHEISATSTLTIQLASASSSPILVKVKTSLVEEGGSWTTDAEAKKMESRSQFWFSNPLVRTVRFDDILPESDHYVNIRIESDEKSPCFCSVLSVQKAQCPFSDSIPDAKRLGSFFLFFLFLIFFI